MTHSFPPRLSSALLAMVASGLPLGLAVTDVDTGMYRCTFGILELSDGFHLVAVAMGLFGVAEILSNVGLPAGERLTHKRISLRSMLPSRQEWKVRSEEHTSELQSLMRSSYAVFCLKKKKKQII